MHKTMLLPGTHDGLDAHQCFYRALVDQLPDVVTVVDHTGTVVFTSDSSRGVLGQEPDERTGRSAFDLIHPQDIARVKAAFERTLLADEGGVVVEYRCRRGDGTWQVLEGTGRRSFTEDGAPVVIVQSRAVPARMPLDTRKSDEDALDAVARISAAIARDFDELISTLGQHMSALDAAPSASVREEARAMRRTLERSRVLVDQLLAFEPHDDTREETSTDVNEVIEAAAHEAERAAGEHVELTYLLGAAPSRVRIARAALGLVLVSIVEYARYSAPRGRRLTILTRNATDVHFPGTPAEGSTGAFVVIEVNNSGRVPSPNESGVNLAGSGPGLHTAESIVRRAGGRIAVTFDDLTGTTLHAALPLYPRS